MRIAALVKQIPKFEEMELGPDGRLRRDGVELEMNAYCRRAVAQAVVLASEQPGSSVTVLTLGPPSADDTLREAIAWATDRGVEARGVHLCDPAFAGSDTLATARALAAALRREGPFDLVLVGRNSVDADTGQVGPELAELLDLPFATGVREMVVRDDGTLDLRCEHDDGWVDVETRLPAILSCAERLTDPSKVDTAGRAAVPAHLVRRVSADDLGPGPWGAVGSPTHVGPVRQHETQRARRRWPDEPLAGQVAEAVRVLAARGALDARPEEHHDAVPASRADSPCTMVVCEPDRPHANRELLGAAQRLTGNVLAATVEPPDAPTLVSWGADEIVHLDGPNVEETVAGAVLDLYRTELPPVILASSTAWGREVASRVAARLGAGLTGDAVDLELDDHESLVAWKPAFGGQLVAAIGYRSTPQMATVRAGVLPTLAPRPAPARFGHETRAMRPRGRVHVRSRTRDDDLDTLAEAHSVIGVGRGVRPDEYGSLEPLRAALGAEFGATRKVTDEGWMPRARQIGITGRAIAPRLFVSIGASGKFNHMVGVRAAGTVLAINPDAAAPVFDAADVGIVADWHEAVPLLVAALEDMRR